MFTGRVWNVALRCFGIRRERIRVRSPWQNGRVERFFGTLKPALAKVSLSSPAALQGALDDFVQFYKHVRVHQGLGGADTSTGLARADLERRAPVRRCAGAPVRRPRPVDLGAPGASHRVSAAMLSVPRYRSAVNVEVV